jgi:hypothetical protein
MANPPVARPSPKTRFLLNQRQKRRENVTICAAAICKHVDRPVVIAVSDRMMTSDDIEYKGGQSKVYTFSNVRCLCLSAGVIDLARTICDDVNKRAGNEKLDDIGLVARAYADQYGALRRRRAEQLYLSPLGLDAASFLNCQGSMNPDLARETTYGLLDYNIDLSAIILGVDSSGPHIYRVDHPGTETCCDHSGFVSIGSGARQFESLFMSSSYGPQWSMNEALFLAYSAKKKAEVSPGVGTETDISVCWATGIGPVDEGALQGFERLYQQVETAITKARVEAVAGVYLTIKS